MEGMKNLLALVFLALYVLSPLDAVPGPVDDLLVLLCYYWWSQNRNRLS